jgi:hypothetical protein
MSLRYSANIRGKKYTDLSAKQLRKLLKKACKKDKLDSLCIAAHLKGTRCP